MVKALRILLTSALSFLSVSPLFSQASVSIRGWNILSDSWGDDTITIKTAKLYDINHLQLSHDVVMDLRELRDPGRQKLAADLTELAHRSGIAEVVAWDHALYDLDYYPEEFRTGPGGTIDLDNKKFWKWFRADYRKMMSLVPELDGIVLTFIETGARAENQYSKKLAGPEEKLAAVVDAVAGVVCGELGKKLYVRTFSYTEAEYRNIIGCIEHIKSRDIILMMKETPHDFFLTHPNDKYAGTIERPTIIEFDCGNEFNGQGVIANTWPDYVLRRWSDFITRPNVIGYVARTDRYRNTRIVGTPNEILLYALKRYAADRNISAGTIYDEFIEREYGREAIPYLKPAFMLAYDIVTSSLYTLGTNTANHSKLDYDPYKSSYGRHVSGKWIDPPVVRVGHGIDRQFHYWKDVIEHIAPARMKLSEGDLRREAPFVIDSMWVTAEEKMNEEYLKYIIEEKAYGVRLAEEALAQISLAGKVLDSHDYEILNGLFRRTLITAKVHKAAASAYFAYRVYARGPDFRTMWLKETLSASLHDLLTSASEIDDYTDDVPRGQWNWRGDAAVARKYHKLITETGWPEYNNIAVKPADLQKFPQISGKSWKSVATSMPSAWYGTYESLRVAENVLLYQRDAGGWPKNTEMHKLLSDAEKAGIIKDKSLGDAIFDNSATTTEMKFLARMHNSTGREDFRLSFNRGLRFILDAQYDNGGWPMFYPLRKGYYTHITFNDNAIVNILEMLREIDSGDRLYSEITDPSLLPRIEKAISSGISCILRTQIIVKGKPTVWCAQHDENTFLPAKARSYELPSFSGAESVGITLLLMDIENPTPEIIRSVEGAVNWFDRHRLSNTRMESFTNSDGLKDRRLITDPAAGDMWARFYDLDTGEPFVCDRDGIKKKSLEEIGYERRNGYSWYTDDPEKIFRRYPEWKKLYNITSPGTEK